MSANPPSDPDASPKSEPGEDGDDPGESDHEDTEPLQTLNPYGAGWGAGWGASWGSVARPDSVERSGRSEPVQQSERPVMGDVELPAGPRPFEFPTPPPGPARGDRSRMALIGVSALAVLAAVGGLIFWLMNRSPSSPETETAATTPSGAPATTTTEPPRRNAEAETRLMRMLPPGYPPGTCQLVDPTRSCRDVQLRQQL